MIPFTFTIIYGARSNSEVVIKFTHNTWSMFNRRLRILISWVWFILSIPQRYFQISKLYSSIPNDGSRVGQVLDPKPSQGMPGPFISEALRHWEAREGHTFKFISLERRRRGPFSKVPSGSYWKIMGWLFMGKFYRKPSIFPCRSWDVPVIFPFNQSIDGR